MNEQIKIPSEQAQASQQLDRIFLANPEDDVPLHDRILKATAIYPNESGSFTLLIN
jgi:hypothetical protein